MKITDVQVRKVAHEGKLRAYMTVTFDGELVVHNIKLIEGKSGLFIAMPSRKTKNGDYKDIIHPISSEFRTMIQTALLEAYETSDKSAEEPVHDEE